MKYWKWISDGNNSGDAIIVVVSIITIMVGSALIICS